MPDSTDAYTHRIGRTGRIGKNGEAFTLVTGEDTTMVQALERLLKKPLERRTLQGFDYAKPAPDNGNIRSPRRSGRRTVRNGRVKVTVT